MSSYQLEWDESPSMTTKLTHSRWRKQSNIFPNRFLLNHRENDLKPSTTILNQCSHHFTWIFFLFNLLVAISKNKSPSVLKLYNELLQVIMCKVAKNIVPETMHSPDVCELCSTIGGRKGKEVGESHLANQWEIIEGTIFSSHVSNRLF